MKKLLFLALFCAFFVKINAQDLVYKPKNPAFGGDTFNYQWLQNSADAQNTFKDPSLKTTSTTASSSSQLDDFTKSLNRLLLSQISQKLITSQFGENGFTPGNYVVGNFDITVGNSTEGVTIDITDLSNGQSTQVIVPFF
jgi:curli production assembly/transport component CsgF